jgi:hypothetical protein
VGHRVELLFRKRDHQTTMNPLLSIIKHLHPPQDPPHMFCIQFDAAGIYLVGTASEQFHVPFEELISFAGGIIGLLEYGLAWKVLTGVLGRARHRLWHRPEISLEQRLPLWIDNSGPVLYEVRYGEDSILVRVQSLESSRFGRALKEHWDGGMTRPSNLWVSRMVFEAFFVGLWRNVRRLKLRKF